jgi:hypothetical protein
MAAVVVVVQNSEDQGTYFFNNSDEGWFDTIKKSFICKRIDPEAQTGQKIAQGGSIYLSLSKAKVIAAVGFILFALALIVAAIAIAALVCPAFGAILAGVVALSAKTLLAIAGAAIGVGLVGLVFGSAAADKIRHIKNDDVPLLFS